MKNHRLIKKSLQSHDSFVTCQLIWFDSCIPELASYLTERKTGTDLKNKKDSCSLITMFLCLLLSPNWQWYFAYQKINTQRAVSKVEDYRGLKKREMQKWGESFSKGWKMRKMTNGIWSRVCGSALSWDPKKSCIGKAQLAKGSSKPPPMAIPKKGHFPS